MRKYPRAGGEISKEIPLGIAAWIVCSGLCTLLPDCQRLCHCTKAAKLPHSWLFINQSRSYTVDNPVKLQLVVRTGLKSTEYPAS